MENTLYYYLGPSLLIQILEVFLQNPDLHMNLTEVSNQIEKNPGSAYPVLPKLVERGLLNSRTLGKATTLYSLNQELEFVKDLIDFREKMNSY